jgi:fructokinase
MNMSHNHIAIFGEALFDHFPNGQQVLGGAPFNVAWHLQAFAQRPSFISRVGLDATGDKIRQAMLAWGMAIEQLQLDPVYPTGTVQVTINDGEPDYEILAGQAYDFITAQQLDAERQYSVIYHGTLALRNPISEQALHCLTANHQGKIFIDVNLRAPWWDKDSVNQWLAKADWVKLNQDELIQLVPQQNTLQTAMRWFLRQYGLEVLVITCGSHGALAINNANEFIVVVPKEALTIADTVGAGDAFSAVLLLGIQCGWTLQQTMERAQMFASALVTQAGATVQDLNFYRPFISDWNLD